VPDYTVVFEIRVPVMAAQQPEDAVYAASLAVYTDYNIEQLRDRIKFKSYEDEHGRNPQSP